MGRRVPSVSRREQPEGTAGGAEGHCGRAVELRPCAEPAALRCPETGDSSLRHLSAISPAFPCPAICYLHLLALVVRPIGVSVLDILNEDKCERRKGAMRPTLENTYVVWKLSADRYVHVLDRLPFSSWLLG